MELRAIPNTPFQVSTLCLGTMTFGIPVGEAEAIRLTHYALEHGINFIDTANIYEGYTRFVGSPGGVAEEILGKALIGKRHKVVLATKVGMKIGPSDDDQGLSKVHIQREIERSLSRLKCDYVDLYYMHRPDPSTSLIESVEAFSNLVKTGKTRAWGVSNFSDRQLSDLLKVCDENSWCRPVVVQPAYSLLKREVENELLPLCQGEHIGVIPYQVLQGGVLSGKYRRGQLIPRDSRQVEKPEWTLHLTEANFDLLEHIEAEAQVRGRSLMQHALKALLEQPTVVSLIVGVKRVEQLIDLIAAVEDC
ncbi:MAG: aldo/keto reductase [Anaerolineales bacterium]|nr:MAG: aldo/keto reductase [Anaerolineales bacterium]